MAAARTRHLWAMAGERAANGRACDRVDDCRTFLWLQNCLEGLDVAAVLWIDFALSILIFELKVDLQICETIKRSEVKKLSDVRR